MAEVLSQSQIDALLSGMLDGGGKMVSEPEVKKEKKYRKYDFSSPKKFTKDRLKVLNGVYESYARIVSSRLNGLLRVNSELQIVAIEEQRYYEFGNALTDSDVLSIINVKVPDKKETMPILFHTTIPLMLSIFDRMLGGSGEEDKTIPSGYTYTDIELSLYENMIKHFISVMKDSWASYLDLEFELDKIETNPSMLQVIGMEETIVIIVIDISIDNVEGKVDICLPGNLLTNIFAVFDHVSSSSRGNKNAEKAPDQIFGTLKGSTLEVTAELGETQVFLSDIYNLHVGDVINLNKPKDSEIYLYIEDKPWFKGKLGVQNKNMAVKINKICEKT